LFVANFEFGKFFFDLLLLKLGMLHVVLKFDGAEVPVILGGSSGLVGRKFRPSSGLVPEFRHCPAVASSMVFADFRNLGGTWAEVPVGGSSGPLGRKFRLDPFSWALEGILRASGRKFRSWGAEVPAWAL
jgi:hypothetical protein